MAPSSGLRRDRADAIADQHGCVILPGGDGRPVLTVLEYYSLGSPADDNRLRRCRAALAAAGVTPHRMI
jgi:hypothetical protein